MNIPYTGITGITSLEERIGVSRFDAPSGRLIMAGVLVSRKTLDGEPAGNPKRYPAITGVSNTLVDKPGFLNMIHYNTDRPETLKAQLQTLEYKIGGVCNGYQLNILWPNPRALECIDPSKRIVLQIKEQSIITCNGDRMEVAARLQEYERVTDVLFDLSGGSGKLIEPLIARLYLNAIRNLSPTIGIGVAGRLSAQTLPLIASLIRDFPDLSWDAESGLRTNDILDFTKVQEYLTESRNILAANADAVEPETDDSWCVS